MAILVATGVLLAAGIGTGVAVVLTSGDDESPSPQRSATPDPEETDEPDRDRGDEPEPVDVDPMADAEALLLATGPALELQVGTPVSVAEVGPEEYEVSIEYGDVRYDFAIVGGVATPAGQTQLDEPEFLLLTIDAAFQIAEAAVAETPGRIVRLAVEDGEYVVGIAADGDATEETDEVRLDEDYEVID